MESDTDVHKCLACQATIEGLMNYVQHKLQSCSAIKRTTADSATEPATNIQNPLQLDSIFESQVLSSNVLTQSLSPNSGLTPAYLTAFNLSPDHRSTTASSQEYEKFSSPCSNVPSSQNNKSTTDNDAADDSYGDFFSVLQLQSKEQQPESDWATSRNTRSQSHSKNGDSHLKISNILNKIQEESDTSDDDFELDDKGDSDDDYIPPHSYTGGKWKPGLKPPRGHTGGKWKPGLSPPSGHTGGKWKPGYIPSGQTGGKWKADQAPPSGYTGGKWKPCPEQSTQDKVILCGTKRGRGRPRKYLDEDKSAPISSHTSGKWEVGEESAADDEVCSIKRKRGRPRKYLEDKSTPPSSHTGGKWDPGEESAAADEVCSGKRKRGRSRKYHDDVESSPPPSHTGGKWKPGQDICSIKAKRGKPRKFQDRCLSSPSLIVRKWVPMTVQTETVIESEYKNENEAIRSDNSDLVDETASEANRSMQNPVSESEDVTVEDVSNYDNTSENNPNLADNDTDKGQQEINTCGANELVCGPCQKYFPHKRAMALHLKSSIHQKRSKNHPDNIKLLEKYKDALELLSPFKCAVCKFFTDNHEQLMHHLQKEDHEENCKDLTGPLLCVLCDVRFPENKLLLQHLQTDEHADVVNNTCRSCVIKESRYELTCNKCGKFFHSAVHLKRHLNGVHRNKTKKLKPSQRNCPKCPHCSMACNSEFNLNVHIRRKHTKERPFQCVDCNLAYFDKGSLIIHRRSKRHKEIVSGVRNLKSSLVKTKTSPLAKRQIKFKCDHCDYTTDSYASLRPHYIATHAKKQTAKLSNNKHFSCTICGSALADKNKLHIHMISHQMKCAFFEKDLDREQSVTWKKYNHLYEQVGGRYKSRDKKRVKCPQCAVMLSSDMFWPHLREHEKEYPFSCPQCDMCYARSGSLRRHMYVHLPAEDRTCKHCELVFASSTILKQHIRRAHEGIRPFLCQTCGAGFAYRYELASHEKIRHGNKQFKCTFEGCRKEFRTKSEFTIHTRIHTGERPFLCTTCGYGAKSRQALSRHILVHTGEKNYSCQYCTYKASNSTHLRRHMRIHVGSKPYQCPYCDYKCNTMENIRKHIMTNKQHEGLKVYSCKFCNNFSTNVSKEFRYHVMDAHKEEIVDKKFDVISIFTGLYHKQNDPGKPAEGQVIHHVAEKTRRRQQSAEDVTSEKPAGDHRYSRHDIEHNKTEDVQQRS